MDGNSASNIVNGDATASEDVPETAVYVVPLPVAFVRTVSDSKF